MDSGLLSPGLYRACTLKDSCSQKFGKGMTGSRKFPASGLNISAKQTGKYAADFTEVYNQAWAGHGGLKQLHIKNRWLPCSEK